MMINRRTYTTDITVNDAVLMQILDAGKYV